MKITLSLWMEVVGIKCEGLKVGKGNIATLEDFNKIHFFRSYLRNPRATVKVFHVGGLAMKPRIKYSSLYGLSHLEDITMLSYMKKTSY